MKKPVLASLSILILAGCMGNGTTGPRSMPVASGQAHGATLALGCTELAERQERIRARTAELERESKAGQRSAVLTDTVLGLGMGAILGVGAQGGVHGLRATSATVQGIEAVRVAERGSGQYSDVTDLMALAMRSAELQSAMIEKGC